MQVPVGHVVGLVAENRGALEQARHEVDPFLIDEQPLGNVDAAVVDQALMPPREETPSFGGVGEADEAQVVGAGAQDGLLVGDESVARDWLEQMRDERDTRFAKFGDQLGQRAVDDDVGVEVDDGRLALVEHVRQERRLDRGTELGHVVLKGHLAEARQRQVGGPHNAYRHTEGSVVHGMRARRLRPASRSGCAGGAREMTGSACAPGRGNCARRSCTRRSCRRRSIPRCRVAFLAEECSV